jgi:hypothetical protein
MVAITINTILNSNSLCADICVIAEAEPRLSQLGTKLTESDWNHPVIFPLKMLAWYCCTLNSIGKRTANAKET